MECISMEILARAVGRRKEAVAQVQLVRGNGQFLINDRPARAYLQNNSCSLICIKSPLQAALSLFSLNPQIQPNGQSNQNTAIASDKTAVLAKPKGSRSPSRTSAIERPGLLMLPSSKRVSLISDTPPINQAQSVVSLRDTALPKNIDQGTSLASILSQGEIDIIVKVKGGGVIGQAEAIKLGVARAFCVMENESGEALLRKILKAKGYLTQDSRVKERRKYGLKKARKASQYHKR